MTASQVQRIKNNVLIVFIIANFSVLLGTFYRVGVIKTTIEKNIENHIENEDIHRALKSDIIQFVPRMEYNIEISGIKKSINETKRVPSNF